MTCARCEALKAEVAELREEVAAWKAWEATEARAEGAVGRLGRWSLRFRLTASQALILIALVDNCGRPLSRDTLLNVVQSGPGRDRAREIRYNLIDVLVYRLRKILDRDGLGDAIQTMRHVGYLVPVLAATALRSRVGEA